MWSFRRFTKLINQTGFIAVFKSERVVVYDDGLAPVQLAVNNSKNQKLKVNKINTLHLDLKCGWMCYGKCTPTCKQIKL